MIGKQTVSVGVVCDICGEHFPEAQVEDGRVHWPEHHGKCDFTSVHTTREHYWPDGDNYESVHSYHICPKCFRTRLAPWLQTHGAKPTITNIDLC